MEQRSVLISGGARGIGRGVAAALAADGHLITITARDRSEAVDAARELSDGVAGEVRGAKLEVSDPDSVRRLVDEVANDPGRLDTLVNNAGVVGGYGTPAAELDLADVREVLEINLLGAWELTQVAMPLLRKSPAPRIVNLSSGMGQLDEMGGGAAAYRVSKAGLNALTRVIANEERDAGVLANTMCPGWVQTDLGGPNANRSIEEGADTAVWLATLPDDGPSGAFFRDREPIPW